MKVFEKVRQKPNKKNDALNALLQNKLEETEESEEEFIPLTERFKTPKSSRLTRRTKFLRKAR